MSVTKEDVAYIANLARLQPDEAQTETLMRDMNRILEYMEQLNQVDTSDVAPLDHVIEIPPTTARMWPSRHSTTIRPCRTHPMPTATTSVYRR